MKARIKRTTKVIEVTQIKQADSLIKLLREKYETS